MCLQAYAPMQAHPCPLSPPHALALALLSAPPLAPYPSENVYAPPRGSDVVFYCGWPVVRRIGYT